MVVVVALAREHEALTDQVHLRDNYFGSNAGAAVEYLTIHPPSDRDEVTDHSTNGEVSGNVFVNDGINNQFNSEEASNAQEVRMTLLFPAEPFAITCTTSRMALRIST